MLDKKELNSEVKSEPTVKLWNPAAVNGWMWLFTPIFSAFLHAKNWEALNQPQKAKNSTIWFYVLIVLFIGSFLIPDEKARGLVVWLMILYYFFSGRKQTKYVKENNIVYEKKPWLKPILLGLLIPLSIIIVLSLSWAGIEKASNNDNIESSSVSLVSQIIEEQLEGDAKCKAVHIEKEVIDGFYHAIAYLDNGNELRIYIEQKGNELYVTIPEQ